MAPLARVAGGLNSALLAHGIFDALGRLLGQRSANCTRCFIKQVIKHFLNAQDLLASSLVRYFLVFPEFSCKKSPLLQQAYSGFVGDASYLCATPINRYAMLFPVSGTIVASK